MPSVKRTESPELISFFLELYFRFYFTYILFYLDIFRRMRIVLFKFI